MFNRNSLSSEHIDDNIVGMLFLNIMNNEYGKPSFIKSFCRAKQDKAH